jgi:hypothetical protein
MGCAGARSQLGTSHDPKYEQDLGTQSILVGSKLGVEGCKSKGGGFIFGSANLGPIWVR